MKQRWIRLGAKIDALSLRERVMLFGGAAAAIVFVAYVTAIAPMLRKQAVLRAQISQQQDNLAGIDGEITQKVKAYQVDPDAATRARLAAVKIEAGQLSDGLRAMQKGLVAPERMGALLETILRANGRLQLVSMKTLPVGSLNEAAPGGQSRGTPPGKDAKVQNTVLTAAAKPAAAKSPDLLYRHGVEIAVRGNYLDMVNYMAALEAMPTQLFWGKAQLEVEEYPNARLTLTLYTLSLDPKWMKL
ncbi:MAG: type II secretion system protein GspM [Massilia sp.]